MKVCRAAADTRERRFPGDLPGLRARGNFQSPGSFARNAVKNYQVPPTLALNQWALAGSWKVAGDKAVLDRAPGRVVFRFRARDLHLVLGPGADHKPLKFHVLLDGKPPGTDHGMDVDADGNGVVREQRLYQLIRQKNGVQEHEFTIEFLDAACRGVLVHLRLGAQHVRTHSLTAPDPVRPGGDATGAGRRGLCRSADKCRRAPATRSPAW